MTETAAIEVLPGGRPATALSLAGLEVRFGGVVAVWDVTLSVPEGQLLGIIGANGAGKSSTLKAILRQVEARAEAIAFRGVDLRSTPPHRVAIPLGVIPSSH